MGKVHRSILVGPEPVGPGPLVRTLRALGHGPGVGPNDWARWLDPMAGPNGRTQWLKHGARARTMGLPWGQDHGAGAMGWIMGPGLGRAMGRTKKSRTNISSCLHNISYRRSENIVKTQSWIWDPSPDPGPPSHPGQQLLQSNTLALVRYK